MLISAGRMGPANMAKSEKRRQTEGEREKKERQRQREEEEEEGGNTQCCYI